MSRFVFDGLGNHDRKRSTVLTNQGNPHYFWDWHDVHFVQLNLFPTPRDARRLRGRPR